MSNPVYDLHSHELNTGELLSKLLLYELEYIAKKGCMGVIMISFTQPGCMDQGCSETPQFVTNKMNIKGLHSAEGHCYLQYSLPYRASVEITNQIDNLFTTIYCSHTMSTNGSPLKKTTMAPPSGLLESQQRPDDSMGVSDNNAGNTPSKNTR